MPANFIPCITFLNGSGDLTISWTPENESTVKALVAEKLKQGFSFFVIKPRLLCFGSKRVPLTDINQLRGNVKGVVVPDEVIEAAVAASKATVADEAVARELAKGTVQSVRHHEKPTVIDAEYTRDVEQITKNQVVAVRVVTGG